MIIERPIRYRLTLKAIEYLSTHAPLPRGREGEIKVRKCARHPRGYVRARRIKFSTNGPGLPRADRVALARAKEDV